MPTTYDGVILDQGGAVFNAKSSAYGAKGDGKIVYDGAINASSTTLTSATASFGSTDVGKLIVVKGAGASGVALSTTIASYINSTSVTLTSAAGTTVTGAKTVFGTNDTAALQAAITAAATGGTLLPGGTVLVVGVSLITSTLTVSPGVSICGQRGVLVAAGAAFGPMLTLDGSGFGNRFGVLSDLQIDGNGIATVGLNVGLAVERDFRNLRVTGCTSVGTQIRGAQNCTFISVNNEDNGTTGTYDTNLLLDLGAGNNAFLRCECSATTSATNEGRYNLLIRQNGTSPSGAYVNGPEGNSFYRCIFERASSLFVAQVYSRAGRFNYFHNCSIGVDGTATIGVKADSGDASSGFLFFRDCQLSGGTNATAFNLSSFQPLVVADTLVEGFTNGFYIDDSSFVEIQGRIDGLPTNMFVQPGGHTKNLSQLVTGSRIAVLSLDASGSPVSNISNSSVQEYYNPATKRRWLWDGGAWRYVQYT